MLEVDLIYYLGSGGIRSGRTVTGIDYEGPFSMDDLTDEPGSGRQRNREACLPNHPPGQLARSQHLPKFPPSSDR